MKTKMNFTKAKRNMSMIALLLTGGLLNAQQAYDNFEGQTSVCYNVTKGGKIDTTAANPSPDKINGSSKCAKYVRNGKQKYDNIKMCTQGRLSDVVKYATYTGQPEKIKMKVYTTAPVGTMIELQLGKRNGPAYPEGINSQYQAVTTVSGAWEELEFKFSQTPQGSQTSFEEVDQITLLFNPNSNTEHVYYFDEITGPPVVIASAAGASKDPAVNSQPAVQKNKPVNKANDPVNKTNKPVKK